MSKTKTEVATRPALAPHTQPGHYSTVPYFDCMLQLDLFSRGGELEIASPGSLKSQWIEVDTRVRTEKR